MRQGLCVETVRIRIEGGLQASRICDTMSAIKPKVTQGLVQQDTFRLPVI